MTTTPTDLRAGAALRLAGRDALGVLHRIATQKLDDLPPGGARTTAFCDFRGRLLHRAVVAHAPDGAVWLLRPDAPSEPLAAFVDRHVFREDVAIDDRTASLPVRWVAAGDAETAWRDAVPGRVPFAPGAALDLGASAAPGLSEVDRIRMGLARSGHEITEAFTPYEVGLAPAVHLDKGCFTGQEALMRLVTYESVRRGIALVQGQGAAPQVPADLAAGETRGNVLTSAAPVPGGWLGLAVLSLEAMAQGARVLLGDSPLEVTPFPATRPLGRP